MYSAVLRPVIVRRILKTSNRIMIILLSAMILFSCSATRTSSGSGEASQAPASAAASVVEVDALKSGEIKETSTDIESEVSSDTKTKMPVNFSSGVITGNIVYFDFDKSIIRPDAHEVLLAYAAYLSTNNIRSTLDGHCDERGTRQYNLKLGESRGKAVRDFLITHGVDPSRLTVISYGEDYPADLRHNEDAWAKNRRVEIMEEKHRIN